MVSLKVNRRTDGIAQINFQGRQIDQIKAKTKTIKIILCFSATFFLFNCSYGPKENLEKNIQTSLEIYLESQLKKDESMKGAHLDSVVITKIDTVTPLYKTNIYKYKVINEMTNLEKRYEATKNVLDKAIVLNKSRNQMFKSLSSEERASVQTNTGDFEKEIAEIQNKYLSYKNNLDSCQKIIDNPRTDNKTLLGYFAFFRLKVTKNDMTQLSIDLEIELTKNFRIIENTLEE